MKVVITTITTSLAALIESVDRLEALIGDALGCPRCGARQATTPGLDGPERWCPAHGAVGDRRPAPPHGDTQRGYPRSPSSPRVAIRQSGSRGNEIRGGGSRG